MKLTKQQILILIDKLEHEIKGYEKIGERIPYQKTNRMKELIELLRSETIRLTKF